MSQDNAQLIFEKWKAELRSKDRSRKAVPGNFDELFEELKRDGVDFQTAHDILPKAIKAHQPSASLAKKFYKELKKASNFSKTEQEFIDDWNQSISDAGTESFYSFFDLKKEVKDDDEPKVFGNMSAREYRAQRKYAESFPVIDTNELEERLRAFSQYNIEDEDDLLNVLGEIDG